MTSGSPHRLEIVAGPDARAAILDGVMPPERDGVSSAPLIAAGNVVPFVRPHREPAVPVRDVDPAVRPAPDRPPREARLRIMALLALSVAVHGGLYFVFRKSPEPMASIALDAISVEIVLGADTPAGIAASPQPSETQTAPADDPNAKAESETAAAKADESPTAPPVETAEVAPPEAPVAEAKPEPPATSEQPPQAEPPRPEPPPPEPPQSEPQQSAALAAEPAPEPAAPAEPVVPQLEERPTPPSETKVAPEPPPKPVRHESRPAKPHEARPQRQPDERHTRTASLHPAARAAPANPASGIGIGRAQSDTNYRGLVVAHLARYKQFPPDARSRGEQGSATVSFSLDGGGRVTRVALVRGSGFASLDHEAQAMVRRASPFPPPPDGHPASFTAPVSFRIQ